MTVERLRTILNDTSVNQHIVIMKTVEFLKQPEIMNPLINSIIRQLREDKNASHKAMMRLFIKEFSPYIIGTRYGRNDKLLDNFCITVATFSNISNDIRYHYARGNVLYEDKPETVVDELDDEQKRINEHMAKMREAKARKRKEREARLKEIKQQRSN